MDYKWVKNIKWGLQWNRKAKKKNQQKMEK